MKYDQLSLFPSDSEKSPLDRFVQDSVSSVTINDVNETNETVVYVYSIYDPETKKRYVGISQYPDYRLRTYQKGAKCANSAFKSICNDRWDSLSKDIICKFVDYNYVATNPKCRARIIEAFVINFFNAIDNGFNKYLGFHHDYYDADFWEDILPEELVMLYQSCDPKVLNERSEKHVRNISVDKVGNEVKHLEFKEWAVDYLITMKNNSVKVQKLAHELMGLDRSNFHRTINNRLYNRMSARTLYKLIRRIEQELNIIPVECPVIDDLSSLKIQESWCKI